MSNAKDFVIDSGKLKQYTGRDSELIIPDSVERIECSFYENRTLRKVVMPDSVTYGGWKTFDKCANLREVKLSEQLEQINPSMFRETALERVTVPARVEKIGNLAFAWCKSLKEVILPSENIEIAANAFSCSPHVVIYCKKELCRRLHLTLNRPCFPLDAPETVSADAGQKDLLYYEDAAFMAAFPQSAPLEKAATFKVQVGGKELKVRIKPESCLDKEFGTGNPYYPFAEVREHYVSREEVLEEYDRQDPNHSSDGFLYVTPRLNPGAKALTEQDAETRMAFIRAVYRSLCEKETVQKLAEFAPKKKNGLFNAAGMTRIACAGMAGCDLMIPEIVAKAKDETTLEVFAKQFVYTPEEAEKLENGFLASLTKKASAGMPAADSEEPAGEEIVTEVRLGDLALPLSLVKDGTGKLMIKTGERAMESFPFVKGSPEKGYDFTIDGFRDSIVSAGLSVTAVMDLRQDFETSWKGFSMFADYYRSKREKKDFDAFFEAFKQLHYCNLDKDAMDDVCDPAERIDACIFAALCAYETISKNHKQYAQEITDQLARKKDGTLSGSGGNMGVNLVKDAGLQNIGVIPFLSGRASGGTEVSFRFECYPGWGSSI